MEKSIKDYKVSKETTERVLTDFERVNEGVKELFDKAADTYSYANEVLKTELLHEGFDKTEVGNTVGSLLSANFGAMQEGAPMPCGTKTLYKWSLNNLVCSKVVGEKETVTVLYLTEINK